MKCLFFIISLLSISLQAVATCSYSKTGGGAITVSFNGSVIADSTLPNGSILASARRGSVNPKTFSSCSSSDVYVVRTVPVVSPSNITKIGGKIVYETGIPGIGFQISDITLPSVNYFSPAEIDQPEIASNHYFSKASGQVMVWLVKTGPITKQKGNKTAVYFMAGPPNQTNTGASNTAELFRINVDLTNITFKETTCEISPRNGGIVKLSTIDISDLNSVAVGSAAGKSKNIALDINCPDSEINKKYVYWFSPISVASTSVNGLLLNSLPDGAQNIGIILKKNGSAIKFNDLSAYPFVSTKSQDLTLTADYFKIAKNVSAGITGEIKTDLEVILQEE